MCGMRFSVFILDFVFLFLIFILFISWHNFIWPLFQLLFLLTNATDVFFDLGERHGISISIYK